MRGRKSPGAWFTAAAKMMEDPTSSDWLKLALSDALNRDPASADKDATALQEVLHLRACAVLQKPRAEKKSGAAAASRSVSSPAPMSSPEKAAATVSMEQSKISGVAR
jgi:hypothetical protein